jgi:hypothetical protein
VNGVRFFVAIPTFAALRGATRGGVTVVASQVIAGLFGVALAATDWREFCGMRRVLDVGMTIRATIGGVNGSTVRGWIDVERFDLVKGVGTHQCLVPMALETITVVQCGVRSDGCE